MKLISKIRESILSKLKTKPSWGTAKVEKLVNDSIIEVLEDDIHGTRSKDRKAEGENQDSSKLL